MRKTKIICTLGPSTDTKEILKDMMLSGMNVARMNFSHDVHKTHKKRVDLVKELREELNLPVALLLDTRGPEIRTKDYKNGSVDLKDGDLFSIRCYDSIGDENGVSVNYEDLYKDLHKNDRVLIDDGLIELEVKNIEDKDIICKVLNSGTLSNKKSVNIPGIRIKLPYMSDKDKEDILFAIKNDFDFIAASFIRDISDLKCLREFMDSNGGSKIKIISKVESKEGVDNIKDIIRLSDGIMIARGDMGVEIHFEELPVLQKQIIRLCNRSGKPVITATQMLDSMIKNPRPTRAETSDVANAIFDGTSAIMLSAETSVGKYPVDVVKTMSKIALNTEQNINYEKRFREQDIKATSTITSAISYSTCSTAHNLGANAIITVTKSGTTARMISKFRPACPIVAPTILKKIFYQLSLSWGVTPIFTKEKSDTDAILKQAVDKTLELGKVKDGDLVVLTGGFPSKMSGTTNMLKVHIVGNVLMKAKGLNNKVASGNLYVVKDDNEDEILEGFTRGGVLVVSKSTLKLVSLLREASAVITEEDSQSNMAIGAIALGIPVLYDASDATEILRSGTLVTVDAKRGEVIKGIG
ncbi:MAG: pyruvate kinase [Candidatus Cloacimonadota bacterium]|nr:MAG: pyruvate kinase [Candidatus Cloacimonadota bacterium]PIE80176.1 MAG: pyruvate kinase [Candidatus Delongbacteria bacterium]